MKYLRSQQCASAIGREKAALVVHKLITENLCGEVDRTELLKDLIQIKDTSGKGK